MATKLTASELAVLRAIDATPDKVMDWSECRRAAGLTPRGARVVMHRMMDNRLIGASEAPATYRWPALTFKGMQALAKVSAS
jgi:hypothetical protein